MEFEKKSKKKKIDKHSGQNKKKEACSPAKTPKKSRI